MIKECVVLNGQVINIGPWDYQIQPVQVGQEEVVIEPEKEVDGETIPAVIELRPIFEDQETNPLPEGAEIVELDVEYSDEHGWRVVGTPVPETDTQKIARLESEKAPKTEVATLDERTLGMQDIDEYTLGMTVTLEDRTQGMQDIDEYSLELIFQLMARVEALESEVQTLKGGT